MHKVYTKPKQRYVLYPNGNYVLYPNRNSGDRLFKSICVILLEQFCLGSGLMKAVAQTQVSIIAVF